MSEQIFNCDETGLYWKRMPNRTFLTKEEKKAPELKVAKDRLTLLLCANVAGTLRCKPMLVYRSETPRALKGKKKEHLPVFWKSNKTAWVTQINFKEWLNKSFFPEVKEYLEKKNLACKILLLLDNCKSHGDSNLLAHPNIEVLFLPPNTTSLIQPMDQTVIATFKAYYLRRVLKSMVRLVNQHRGCADFNPENVVRSFWKKFSIADSIGIIKESWQEILESTLNASWSKLLPNFVNKKQKSGQIIDNQSVFQGMVSISREIGGEGFADMQETEILEIVSPGKDLLTTEEVEEIVELAEEKIILPDDEIEETEKKFHTVSLLKIITSMQDAIDEAANTDPIMTRSLNFKHSCDLALQIYLDLYKDYQKKIKQSRITDFFSK